MDSDKQVDSQMGPTMKFDVNDTQDSILSSDGQPQQL